MIPRPLSASVLLLALAACGPAPSKLSELKAGLFAKKCATSGCHSGGTSAAQGLDLSTGDLHAKLVGASSTLVASKKLVVANSPSTSFLYEKVAQPQPSSGARMPSTPPYLTQAELDQLSSWIDNGAPND